MSYLFDRDSNVPTITNADKMDSTTGTTDNIENKQMPNDDNNQDRPQQLQPQ